jgi:hypothetical protein
MLDPIARGIDNQLAKAAFVRVVTDHVLFPLFPRSVRIIVSQLVIVVE